MSENQWEKRTIINPVNLHKGKNACHLKPKAKYPIKTDEEKGSIINQQEHKKIT